MGEGGAPPTPRRGGLDLDRRIVEQRRADGGDGLDGFEFRQGPHGLFADLRVRVVANMEFRIESVVDRCNMTRERAVEYIRELDQERDNWVRWVYGIDSNDPATYDMVINLEHIPVPTACEVVAATARREFQTTPEAQRKADDLALASEIRARMGLDKSISDERIVISAEDGVVTITCDARRLAEAEHVKAMALQIPSVKDIQMR